MTPDQLKYLTDEERRAWEELSGFFAAGLNIVARRLNGSRKAAPINRYMPGAERYLSAALEALADARRERDEARALLRHLAEAYRGTLVRAPSDHACAECVADKHLSDDAVEAGFRCPYHELRAFITPGEDPAPHGAGAPDASGGASGVGVLTNCDSCRWNRTEDDGDETCDNPDDGHIGDGIAWWSTKNCGARFKCRPGATGCPGWAKRGEE